MMAVNGTQKLRQALGAFPTGVTVVTAHTPSGQRSGVTVNSFSSVSLDPPLVLWCLSRTAPSRASFLDATHFAVHVLSQEQEHLARRFCAPVRNRFEGLDLLEGAGGAPIFSGVSALFECHRRHVYEGGDHIIFVGEVLRYHHSVHPPLVFHESRYGALQETVTS
jgi:flavin reductase (DIM6/NTAB) family NADH-FMN oxidoreductase RutF